MARISKGSYYRWLKTPYKPFDEVDELIANIFEKHNQKVGYRFIKMQLQRNFGISVNHKRIKRSMRAQALFCTIRRRKFKRKRFHIESRIERAFPDLVQRRFSPPRPDMIYSGDVTEFKIQNSLKVYFHAVKDLGTHEIVSYNASLSPNTDLVIQKFREHLKTLGEQTRSKLIYHTDQGGVFMSDPHINMTRNLRVRQSMSRRGNCLDNSPIESFFGHMKDYLDFKKMRTLEEVKVEMKKYVDFYNFDRPEWGLQKMTPAEYRSHLIN